MKRLWIPLFSSILAFTALVPAHYSVSPAYASISPYIEAHGQEIGILEHAEALHAKYGSRPPYKGPSFGKFEPLSADQAETVLPYILACESGARNVSEIDSNGKWSRGLAQFQDATWHERQAASGIQGTATEAIPAVDMSLWSLEHGYVWQWSCARILKIVD